MLYIFILMLAVTERGSMMAIKEIFISNKFTVSNVLKANLRFNAVHSMEDTESCLLR